VSQAEDRQADPASGARDPDARGNLLFIAITAAVLLVFLSFNALNVFDELKRAGRPHELWEPMVWEGSSGLVFLSLSPLILALVRRVWPADPPYLPKLATIWSRRVASPSSTCWRSAPSAGRSTRR
jgi:hypothetical protein